MLRQPADRQIYERGCVRAGEDWLEDHAIQVIVFGIVVMFIQVKSTPFDRNARTCFMVFRVA